RRVERDVARRLLSGWGITQWLAGLQVVVGRARAGHIIDQLVRQRSKCRQLGQIGTPGIVQRHSTEQDATAAVRALDEKWIVVRQQRHWHAGAGRTGTRYLPPAGETSVAEPAGLAFAEQVQSRMEKTGSERTDGTTWLGEVADDFF